MLISGLRNGGNRARNPVITALDARCTEIRDRYTAPMKSQDGGFTRSAPRPTILVTILAQLLAQIVAWTSVLAGAGCIPGNVSGTNTPDGGAVVGVRLLACSQTPSGCLCAAREAQPDDVVACSTSSVATHSGEQGSCCGSADLCTCDSFACKSDSTLGFCQCGPAADIPAALEGAAAAGCPTPGAGQKCCLTAESRSCVCSTSDCDSGAMTVANCTVALVSTCGPDQTSPASCK